MVTNENEGLTPIVHEKAIAKTTYRYDFETHEGAPDRDDNATAQTTFKEVSYNGPVDAKIIKAAVIAKEFPEGEEQKLQNNAVQEQLLGIADGPAKASFLDFMTRRDALKAQVNADVAEYMKE